jgi:hypothetical protein
VRGFFTCVTPNVSSCRVNLLSPLVSASCPAPGADGARQIKAPLAETKDQKRPTPNSIGG